MKQPTYSDFQRLEKKIILLNDKLDRIMEVQNIELVKAPEMVEKEEEKKRKIRERQQTKALREQYIQQQIKQMIEDRRLRIKEGSRLQRQFNLVQPLLRIESGSFKKRMTLKLSMD